MVRDLDHVAEDCPSLGSDVRRGSALRRFKMKKLLAIAAFVLASTAAQAQYTFEYGGRTIRIDPDRGTVSIPGVYDNTGRRSKRARGDQDSDKSRKQPAPQDAKADPQTSSPAPAPTDQAAPPPAAANPPPSEPATSTANNAPAD